MSGIAVILVAAGDGTRLGQGIPKALVKIQGKSLLEHALERILEVKGLSQIVVAAHENHVEEFADLANAVVGDKVAIDFAPGGTSRQGSIFNALQKVSNTNQVVLVHDAARCFAPAELFDRVAAAVSEYGFGVVPLLPVADTIKQVNHDVVLATVDRDNLRVAQTPQGFEYQELFDNYSKATDVFTDDAALMQSFGSVIHSVVGDPMAFKITVPSDLAYAAGLRSNQRTGIGTDVHRFSTDTAKPLYLGTLCWEGEIGLDGHSDGDALSHAIVDALLAAAGLGDIGTVFGTDDDKYAGANGSVFLRETKARLAENGWSIVNVSVQLIGNRPKVAPMRERVEKALTDLLGAPVSLGATTTDGLGFLGNSEGVAAVATALIESRL
ncbi:MAG: 2-C-methyl-D-erythritol 4-phosphate cytidylyltransferase [Acidobacteria bacterium]|nr:2-C-methyl-D-erythritol 4-phosphate cytidylyltransferase [Acidobacteriota bacterium]